MIKGMVVLKPNFEVALSERAYCKESCFMTKDKSRVGYFVEDNKTQQFITADRNINTPLYKAAGLVIIKDVLLLEKYLLEGKRRIEELMLQK